MEENLGIAILPDYIHHKGNPTESVSQEKGQSIHPDQNELGENFGIVILPDYLKNEDRNIQPTPDPPKPRKRKRKKAQRKAKKDESWISERIRPVHLNHGEPLPRSTGHLLLGRKAYRNFFNISLTLFLLTLFLNVVIGPINGSGGEVHFDGSKSTYSPMANELVEPGELYPCDPSIQSTGCRNSFTPFFSDSDSMPRGVYLDTQIFAVLGLFALIAVNWASSFIRLSNHGVKIEQAVSFDSINPEQHLPTAEQIERLDLLRVSLSLLAPVFSILIIVHLAFMHIPGEGRPVEFDGHYEVQHPDAPNLYLVPGDVYPCDSTVQISSCDHIIRPSLGGEWIVPLGYYHVHMAMILFCLIAFIGTIALTVEFNRARFYNTIYQQQKIGVSSGELGIEMYKEMMRYGTPAMNTKHLLSTRKSGRKKVRILVTTPVNLRVPSIHRQQLHVTLGNTSKPNFLTRVTKTIMILPYVFARLMIKPFLFLVSHAQRLLFAKSDVFNLTSAYVPEHFDVLDNQTFRMDADFAKIHVPKRRLYGFSRSKLQRFYHSAENKLTPASTSAIPHQRLKSKSNITYRQPIRRLEHWRVKGKLHDISAERIPFTFLHVDERTKGGVQSSEFSDPTVLFVHDTANHRVLVDIAQLE